MPWFKVDDKLWGHPKWLATPPAARGLWVTAGAWCSDHTTDGVIPKHALGALGAKPKDAAALVASGLWSIHPDGWTFPDWLDFQQSAEQVRAARDAARNRQRRARDAAASRRDIAVTHGSVTLPPTRPDQMTTSSSARTRFARPDDTTAAAARRIEERAEARRAGIACDACDGSGWIDSGDGSGYLPCACSGVPA